MKKALTIFYDEDYGKGVRVKIEKEFSSEEPALIRQMLLNMMLKLSEMLRAVIIQEVKNA